VNGRDTFGYLVNHCLMRPRFLIAIIETAIANAINRGHEKVSEDDCIDAVKQHSNSILNDFGYEIRDVSGASEKVLHSLAGATEYITEAEVLERFEKAKIIASKDREKLFDYMLWYGVLGVVNQNNVECYMGASKNAPFQPPRKSDSKLLDSERGMLAWDSLASSIWSDAMKVSTKRVIRS
jgi:hypothetical protein